MARVAYCKECGQKVWLQENESGDCTHPSNAIIGQHETKPERTSKKRRLRLAIGALTIANLLFQIVGIWAACIGIAAVHGKGYASSYGLWITDEQAWEVTVTNPPWENHARRKMEIWEGAQDMYGDADRGTTGRIGAVATVYGYDHAKAGKHTDKEEISYEITGRLVNPLPIVRHNVVVRGAIYVAETDDVVGTGSMRTDRVWPGESCDFYFHIIDKSEVLPLEDLEWDVWIE